MSLIINLKAYFLRKLTYKNSVNFDIKDASSVLFMRYDRIGDMIISTPVFRELKLAYPKITISVLASKTNSAVLINNPYVDNVIVNRKYFLANLKSLILLRKINFDVCIEFDHSVVPHAIIRLKIIKPKLVISVFKDGRYGVTGSELKLYDIFTENKKNTHLCENWLATLQPFGIFAKSTIYDLPYSAAQDFRAIFFLNKYDGKFLIGINLEGAVSGKKIEFNELEELCRRLYNFYSNIQIIVLAEPKKYLYIDNQIKKMNLNYACISYLTNSIMDVAALIDNLDLIITPDTSVVHIASAYNKPVVSIHESNRDSYEKFAPKSKINRTVFSNSIKSLEGFSLDLLISYSIELIKALREKRHN
jgi:ADP-heptose:LPS heptosyltransferase